MDTSTYSLAFTGVAPPVCDAEAGQEEPSLQRIISTGTGTSTGSSFHDAAQSAQQSSANHGFPAGRLRLLMRELCTAIRSALDDERSSAEDSLRRATELLEEIGATETPAMDQARGGLAPWQIRKVTAHVEAHLHRSIRNEDLATLVRLNPSHFGRAFRNSLGEPPHEYVIRRRIERAQGLMLSTDASLSDIALDCGLADQSHLTRLFRRIVGESPRVWRRARIGEPDACV
jgi:AraC family transcriptional regulator